jgi:WD40 repeat protein
MPDQAHQRWLLFDADNIAKVTDTAGNVVFQTRFLSPTAECRSGALSPSGRYVAFAISDKTNEVQIWDVAENTLVRTLPMDIEVMKVGLRQPKTSWWFLCHLSGDRPSTTFAPVKRSFTSRILSTKTSGLPALRGPFQTGSNGLP